MSGAEAAEFSKLADTTYRDVNIALANEFARYADRVGVDIQEVIDGANSQPYWHIHQPGIGVGGHCIPVYPHLLLSRAPDLEVVAVARRTNDAQVGNAIKSLEALLGGLDDVPVLVLGLTYREGVKELAYSRALPLIERLSFHGAQVLGLRPAPVRRGDRAVLRRRRMTWGRAGAVPGDRHPDGRQAVDRRSISRSSRSWRSSSTGATACARSTCRRTSATRASASRRATTAPAGTRPRRVPVEGGRRCGSSASSARGRSSSRPPRSSPRCAATTPRSSSTPASTTTRPWPATSSRSWAWPARTTPSASAAAATATRPAGC